MYYEAVKWILCSQNTESIGQLNICWMYNIHTLLKLRMQINLLHLKYFIGFIKKIDRPSNLVVESESVWTDQITLIAIS